jgi:hypothetical protein
VLAELSLQIVILQCQGVSLEAGEKRQQQGLGLLWLFLDQLI